MPYYEFECSKCGHKFARKESFEQHDRHRRVKCPQCGSTRVGQLIAAPLVKTSKKS